MAEIALSAVQTLLAALDSTPLQEIFSVWGYKSQLNDLRDTVATIRQVLDGAESMKNRLSSEERDYIEKLQDAVYDADDLFDEVLTLAQLKKRDKGDKLLKKVHDFFSPNNPRSNAFTLSREVKKIGKRLDDIASIHQKFRIKLDIDPIRIREETCSYLYAPDVVGRDEDVKAILDKLLDSSVEEDIRFLTIVGVGGLGKTTVAQLVYHDERVGCEFGRRLWVCVLDQDGKSFDVKAIISRILESAGKEIGDGLSKERVQSQFQETLGGNKCLLVLDDVWNEDSYKWRELRGLLMRFGGGSRIIVTSRSKETARIIENDDSFTYELGRLSDEESWSLFEHMAFGKRSSSEHVNPPELVEIGKKIVKWCCKVPLAIKVVGGLLFGQNKIKWQAFEEAGLACLPSTSQDGNMVMSILKLSYDNLSSPLKSCFIYCAIFPKSFSISKEMLISLWMSQGYTIPFYDGQDIEEAANEQFYILLQRCFFQDVEMDEYGDVTSFKIHDLMYDVVRELAGKDICSVYSIGNNLGDCKARHLYQEKAACRTEIFVKSKIRSYIQIPYMRGCLLHSDEVNRLVKNFGCLRTLTLKLVFGTVKQLPDAIGKLVHLRYLNLNSCIHLETLPYSITKLFNLQTFILRSCQSLKELPKDFTKLVNLRHLDITGCSRLTCMPPGLHKLTSLSKLTAFYVAAPTSTGKKHRGGLLRDLKHLNKLKGGIEIIIPVNYTGVEERYQESDILGNMERLNSIELRFNLSNVTHGNDERYIKQESLMEKLKLHPNVKRLELKGYHGQTIPKWGKAEQNWGIFFPRLVKIRLDNCHKLQELSLLSKLELLKSLELKCLYNLEYLEKFTTGSSASFFPSLECLQLSDMFKLKRLMNIEDEDLFSFPRLSKLEIIQCPNLISFPSCPVLETLELDEVNEKLKLINLNPKDVKISHLDDHVSSF